MRAGNRFIPAQGSGTNAVFEATDGEMAATSTLNPFMLYFSTYDVDSGLSRGGGVSTSMNVTVANLDTNDVAHYSAADSVSFAQTRERTALSTWRWNSIGATALQTMIDAGSNRISSTIYDADDDRISDRLNVTDQQYGYLRVVDDDNDPPIVTDLTIDSQPLSTTNYTITDNQLFVGNWRIEMTFSDLSGITRSGSEPNFDLINPLGATMINDRAFDSTSVNGTNTYAWRGWGGSVAYNDVSTGLWTLAWSAMDMDNDRDYDGRSLTNSPLIQLGTNILRVMDDDEDSPTPPTNILVNPIQWTNVNWFEISWDPAVDLVSGIYQYRTFTNSTPGIDDGNPMSGGLVTTNPIVYTITNGSFETGYDELQAPGNYPDGTNGWMELASDTENGFWDSAESHDGSLSMRMECGEGRAGPYGRYLLISQFVKLYNTNQQQGSVTLGGWFKGDLSAGQYGSYCDAFLKIEPCTTSRSVIVQYSNEGEAPGYGINTYGGWSNITLTVTNFPANTEYLLISVGLGNQNTWLPATGWWDYVSCTVKMVSAEGTYGMTFTNAPEGEHTNWLYAVDSDNDRPNDRRMSVVTQFVTYLDQTPPAQISDLVVSEGPDDTSEIRLDWTPLLNGGGRDANTPYSEWYTYVLYYTDEERSPTTNDPSITMENGPLSLGITNTSYAIFSNFVFDTTYRLAMAGRDRAGNLGPISDEAVITLPGFYMTQGVLNASYNPQLFWKAATNQSGQINREYDLIYCDALDFADTLTNQWKLLDSGYTNTIWDAGEGERIAPSGLINTMRFYRAARKDYWLTNRNPRIASVEIYGAKNIRLYPGQNWVALPFEQDTNTLYSALMPNALPGGSSDTDPNAAHVSWYVRSAGQVARVGAWCCSYGSSNGWLTFTPTMNDPANDLFVPIGEGFIVEMPTNTSTVYNHVFVGQVPATVVTQQIVTGTGSFAGRTYNLVNFHGPNRVHPSQMGLLESGFKGGTSSTASDRLRKFNKETQLTDPDIWYDTNVNQWKFTTGGGVPAGYFKPDDAIVIMSVKSTGNWIWTNRVLYSAPTRTMDP